MLDCRGRVTSMEKQMYKQPFLFPATVSNQKSHHRRKKRAATLWTTKPACQFLQRGKNTHWNQLQAFHQLIQLQAFHLVWSRPPPPNKNMVPWRAMCSSIQGSSDQWFQMRMYGPQARNFPIENDLSSLLLLMEEILHHLGCIKLWK